MNIITFRVDNVYENLIWYIYIQLIHHLKIIASVVKTEILLNEELLFQMETSQNLEWLQTQQVPNKYLLEI